MNLIIINDIIGLGESSVDAIRKKLDEFQGQPVKAEINSPGGFVLEGLEIFHMFKNHTGFVHMHVMGMAASMASIIPLAGNKITAEESTIWMIHNVLGGAFGDFRDLQKEADLLKNLRDMLANIIAKRTKQSTNKIKNLMDDETFFFGDESLNFGLVDEIISLPENKKETRNDAIEYAKIAMLECEMKMKKSGKKENSEKVAAMLEIEPKNDASEILDELASLKNKTDSLDNNNKPAESGKEEVSKTMITLETLKAENLDLYNSIIQAGIKQERDRITAHITFMDIAPELATKAILEGAEYSNAYQAQYNKASLTKQETKDAIDDNPANIQTPEVDEDVVEKQIEAQMAENLELTEAK